MFGPGGGGDTVIDFGGEDQSALTGGLAFTRADGQDASGDGVRHTVVYFGDGGVVYFGDGGVVFFGGGGVGLVHA